MKGVKLDSQRPSNDGNYSQVFEFGSLTDHLVWSCTYFFSFKQNYTPYYISVLSKIKEKQDCAHPSQLAGRL